MKYYIYIWTTPITVKIKNTTILAGAPIYVGKGSGMRAQKHLLETQKFRYNELKSVIVERIRRKGYEPQIVLSKEFSKESSAFEFEKVLIKQFGRLIDRSGTLTNLTLGGEGATGFRHSEEQKKKWSKLRKGRPANNKGVKRPGVGGRNKGTSWSDEERKIREERMKTRDISAYQTDEYKKKASERGKELHESGVIVSPAKDSRWYNNGTYEKYFKKGEQPSDWSLGRLKKTSNVKKQGLLWYNNGNVNKQFRLGKEPKGFVRGRVTKKQ